MTVSHSTEHEVRMFPALKILERQTLPIKYGREPYWRAPVVPASADVYIPVWNWQSSADFPAGEAVTVLDVNAAYLSALGAVRIAHSHLVQAGPLKELPEPRRVAPGYYLITVPYWAFSATIVHPLGSSVRVTSERKLWIAAPTLVLLLELEKEGHIGGFEILDSWQGQVATDFRGWAERLRSVRIEFMDRAARAPESQREQENERLAAFKNGYSAALSMMLTGDKCKTRRPDWAHTVYAQHAAATWRKAWRYTYTGRPLVAMGAVDEISVLSMDLPGVLELPKRPFRFDPSGRMPGAFKPKRVTFTCEEVQCADAMITLGESDDIL